MPNTQTTTAPAADKAVADAGRAVRAASQSQSLAEAIQAADDFRQEYERISSAHDDAEEAHFAAKAKVGAAMEEARNAVLVPDQLCFAIDPKEDLIRMELFYADGSTRTCDLSRRGFTPDSRDSLIKHCAEKGLSVEPLLVVWDAWQEAKDDAAWNAAGEEYRRADRQLEKAEANWRRAVWRKHKLAEAVLTVPVASARDAIDQVEAYARLMEIKSATTKDSDAEDDLLMRRAMYRALEALASNEPEPLLMAAE